MVNKLNERQKRFADEYLIDLNAERAAIRAGYSKKYARGNAHKLVANSCIAEYIKKRMAEKEKALIADQDEVMRYLTSVMRREKTESVVVTLSREKSTYVPDDNGTPRKQTVKEDIPRVVEIPARLADANKAAELLGKAHGIYTDKVNAEVELDLNINLDYGDEKEGDA